MTALRKCTQADMRVQAPSPLDAASAVPAFGEFTTALAATFALNNVIEMIPFPAGTVLHSLKAFVGDIDTGATLTLDFGILSGQYLSALDDAGALRTCGTEFATASTIGQAGGAIDVAANLLLGIAPNNKDRSIGFKIAAAAAGVTAGAKIRVAALFMPAPQGLAITTT